MSRSFRKNPIIKDSSKWAKQHANKVVRRTQDVSGGKNYKKVFESWDICDWRIRYTLEECTKRNDSKPKDIVDWYVKYYWK